MATGHPARRMYCRIYFLLSFHLYWCLFWNLTLNWKTPKEGVTKFLKGLNPSNALGPDVLHPRVLKELASE